VNAELQGEMRDQVCQLSEMDQLWLLDAIERLNLSARSYHRLLSVARTLADLASEEHISRVHLMEALGFRALDRYRMG
jgi:magnesium chelatase family protein